MNPAVGLQGLTDSNFTSTQTKIILPYAHGFSDTETGE
jgi:hypothetical protein